MSFYTDRREPSSSVFACTVGSQCQRLKLRADDAISNLLPGSTLRFAQTAALLFRTWPSSAKTVGRDSRLSRRGNIRLSGILQPGRRSRLLGREEAAGET